MRQHIDDFAVDVRCPGGALHFKVVDDCIEIKCSHPACTDNGRDVVFHRFSADGELVDTKRFKDPRFQRPRSPNLRKETR